MTDPFFYSDRLLEARLKLLRSLAAGGDCLNLVIGERGSGKTTLLRSLLASKAGPWHRCTVRFSSRRIAAAGNLHGRRGIVLNTGSPPMLLLDDAHEIDIEGLRYLIRHSLDSRRPRKFRGVILFCAPCPPGFINRLSDSVPSRSVINTLHINPFTFDQTWGFLQQLSQSLGPAGAKGFSPAQAKKIFDASGGLPGKIHREAKRAIRKHEKRNFTRRHEGTKETLLCNKLCLCLTSWLRGFV